MNGCADGLGLILNAPLNGLADPPDGVGAEFVSQAIVRLIDRSHESQIAFLNEIQERDASSLVFAGHADHQPQVGFDKARFQCPKMQGARILRNEAYIEVRRSDLPC